LAVRLVVVTELLPDVPVVAAETGVVVQPLSEYNLRPFVAVASVRLNTTLGVWLEPGDGVEDVKVRTGLVVSITIDFWPAILLAPPTAGRVRIASVDVIALTIVPEFSVNELTLT